jgi:hypothetical protein
MLENEFKYYLEHQEELDSLSVTSTFFAYLF